MTTDLHKLTQKQLGELFPIILSPPRHDWPEYFTREAHRIRDILGKEMIKRIRHVGSTSVLGLTAKPTIDIVVEIAETPGTDQRTIDLMTAGGYEHMQSQKAHIMVVRGYTPRGMDIPSYHIHLGQPGLPKLEDMIRFRDLLRSDPSVAGAYETLKENLAARYRNDREAYTKAKTDFINTNLTKRL